MQQKTQEILEVLQIISKTNRSNWWKIFLLTPTQLRTVALSQEPIPWRSSYLGSQGKHCLWCKQHRSLWVTSFIQSFWKESKNRLLGNNTCRDNHLPKVSSFSVYSPKTVFSPSTGEHERSCFALDLTLKWWLHISKAAMWETDSGVLWLCT